ncbi:MAG: recombinase family protein, partial [Bacteroidales bacterium]|nr:recombinase family protein [Bacteroidales bacterium]
MTEKEYVKYDFGRKCVCVGRVSTTIQSQTAQVRDLEEFANKLGYDEVKPFFTTESGFLEQDDKQGWNLVTDFFESHPDYKVLICPELSRLSRKEHILHSIKDYLIENKIQLIIKDINFFLFNEWGEIPKGNDIIFALYASLADSEMRQKRERFTRSLKDNKQLGYSIGGKELFGYERYYEPKDGKNRSKYRINEKEAEEIKTIYRWYAFGFNDNPKPSTILSVTQECIERGFSEYLHSKRNVNKCLKEQAYCGQKETHNRVKNPDYWNYHKPDAPKYIAGQTFICTYPPIFTGDDAAIFEIVQSKLKQNNTRYSKTGDNLLDKSRKHTNILGKLLKCPECGTYLNAEYRLRIHNERPNLGRQPSYSYRCNYSRGVIHLCGFRRLLGMVMMDSVIWAYCKKAAFQVVNSEANKDVNERIAELDEKITNLTLKIQTYDIDARIKSEDAILRTRTRVLKEPSQIDAVLKEYEEKVAEIEKELDRFKQRKLELENEKDAISQSVSFLDKLNQTENIALNKALLYKYIHRVVEFIEIVAWSNKYIVLKVHFKKTTPFYKKNEFICIYTKTSKKIDALVVYSYDVASERAARQALNMTALNFTEVT